MKVIFNADDFGLTQGVNEGIGEAHKNGVVKSTTMMIGMPAQDHAVALAKQLSNLKIGLHLRFTAGKALTGVSSLTDGDGFFKSYAEFFTSREFEPMDVYEEAKAQIEAFLKLGLPLSHLDSHHHAHTHPQFSQSIKTLATVYQVPLRGCSNWLSLGTKYHFTDQFYDDGVDVTKLLDHLMDLKGRFDVVEVMCHPATIDSSLRDCSSYLEQREKELSVLTDDWLSVMLTRHGIEVTDYVAVASR